MDVPIWQQRYQKRKWMKMEHPERENGIAKPEDQNGGLSDPPALLQDHSEEEVSEDGATREGRGSRRLVAKGNLCYILTNYHKPFHCVHKDCNSAFTNQSGLVRHLQSVHHYNRSQLCLEGDLELQQSAGEKIDSAPLTVGGEVQSLSPKAIKSEEGVEENIDEETKVPVEGDLIVTRTQRTRGLVFRSHEETLQMCQDRCLSVGYPCMVQNCVTVVSHKGSLLRHYVKVHKMSRLQYAMIEEKLYDAEQLEELIQKKSALPDIARVPNGVLKMEYQEEPKTPGAPFLPMSLHSIKPEGLDVQDPLGFSTEPNSDRNVLVGADDLLYGEPSGHTEELPILSSHSHEERPKLQSPPPPLVPLPLLNLSPPSSLRIAIDEGLVDSSGKDVCGKPMNVSPPLSFSAPLTSTSVRQPLKWKNEFSDPLPSVPHLPTPKDVQVHIPALRTFDLTTYKPIGFESSFIKFIQEGMETGSWASFRQCYRPAPSRCHDSHRHDCSVKENSQRGPTITRSRRTRSLPLKALHSTRDCASGQSLRFILERALRGCGDQATIKQLQYLKPVVVLERSKFTTSLLDLFPSETNL